MKLAIPLINVVLVAASVVTAFTLPPVNTAGHANKKGSVRKSFMAMNDNTFERFDEMKKLYLKHDDARKAGGYRTKPIHEIRVEYKEKVGLIEWQKILSNEMVAEFDAHQNLPNYLAIRLDEVKNTQKELIASFDKHKKYIWLAFICLQEYRVTGSLELQFEFDKDNNDLADPLSLEQIFHNNFDPEEFEFCLAAYGLELINIQSSTRPGAQKSGHKSYSTSYQLKLRFFKD